MNGKGPEGRIATRATDLHQSTNAYRQYVLASLTVVTALNYLDRSLITLLLEPIKQDLQLSDTQLGFLTGIAFGLFYAVLGVPVARFADRGDRVNLASLAIGLWGLTVMATLWVTNFWQLAMARVAAAVGESGAMPPTYSLLGDYFPEPESKARAMGIYMLASPLALLVSFILGGWLNEQFGWRVAFFVMGIPGLLVAVILRLTVREPRRSSPPPAGSMPSFKWVLGQLWSQRSSRHVALALVLLFTMGFGLAPWYAAFMMRTHGMGTGELGLWLGLIFGLGGVVGILSGSVVSQRFFGTSEAKQMRLCSVMIGLLVPGLIIFLLVPSRGVALGLLTVLVVISNAIFGPTYTLLQRLVPDSMRATALALIMLLGNLIGMGAAPQMVGLLSDLLHPAFGDDSLRLAMISGTTAAAASAWFFWKVGETVAADLAVIPDSSTAS